MLVSVVRLMLRYVTVCFDVVYLCSKLSTLLKTLTNADIE